MIRRSSLLLVALLLGLNSTLDHRHATGLCPVLLMVTGLFPTVTYCALNTDSIIVASLLVHVVIELVRVSISTVKSLHTL